MNMSKLFNHFRRDRRGIIVPLVVGITLIITTALLWVVSMYPVALFWDAVEPLMPANTHGTMTMLNNVCGWALIVEVAGLLVWMGVHCFRKEVIDIPG